MKPAHSINLSRLWVALLLLLAVPCSFSGQATFGGIVVFGTSLSDPGNAFAFQHEVVTPPYSALAGSFLIPDASYAKGGHHFSNGATWAEQFARSLGLAAGARPAFQSAGASARNYSVGASRARLVSGNFGLSNQIGAFLQDVAGVAPADALYVIEMGSNDVRDAFAVFAAGGDGTSIVTDSIAAIASTVQTLYASGARQFLVWNAPDIGLAPTARMLGPGAVALASSVAAGFNAGLDASLVPLSALPGIHIAKLDVFGLLHEITMAPQSFGLTVVDGACIMPDVPPFECRQPDDYLFWDGIHPTRAAHAIIAQRAAMVVMP
jgi:phospholipase/lecithinase/hemolysin